MLHVPRYGCLRGPGRLFNFELPRLLLMSLTPGNTRQQLLLLLSASCNVCMTHRKGTRGTLPSLPPFFLFFSVALLFHSSRFRVIDQNVARFPEIFAYSFVEVQLSQISCSHFHTFYSIFDISLHTFLPSSADSSSNDNCLTNLLLTHFILSDSSDTQDSLHSFTSFHHGDRIR
jgi:hypothetical protein